MYDCIQGKKKLSDFTENTDTTYYDPYDSKYYHPDKLIKTLIDHYQAQTVSQTDMLISKLDVNEWLLKSLEDHN